MLFELFHHPGPADLVEVANHHGGAVLLTQLVSNDHQLIIQVLRVVARAGRARMYAVKAHLAAIHIDIHSQGRHMFLAEIAFLHLVDGEPRIEAEAVMRFLVEKVCVGLIRFQWRERVAPAGICFRQEDDIGLTVADARQHSGMVFVFL